jgi:hypothetical protein
VRFELDCEEGTIRCRVNDADQGIVFTGLQGQEVFPVVGRTCMQHLVYCVSAFLSQTLLSPLKPLSRHHACVATRTICSPHASPHTRTLRLPSHDLARRAPLSSASLASFFVVHPWTGVHVR